MTTLYQNVISFPLIFHSLHLLKITNVPSYNCNKVLPKVLPFVSKCAKLCLQITFVLLKFESATIW